jgi:hypothetical protein
MVDLIDMLKIATGRKLSQEQMDEAKTGDPGLFPHDCLVDKPETFDNIAINGDKIVRRMAKYRWCITPDTSHEEVSHRGYYVVLDEERKYNRDGLLEERFICKMPGGLTVADRITLVYDPAGRLIGKRKKWGQE